jgi:hypothetical protein
MIRLAIESLVKPGKMVTTCMQVTILTAMLTYPYAIL